MRHLKAFLLGMREFRLSFTTSQPDDLIESYDAGRDLAHRLTLRRFDECDSMYRYSPWEDRMADRELPASTRRADQMSNEIQSTQPEALTDTYIRRAANMTWSERDDGRDRVTLSEPEFGRAVRRVLSAMGGALAQQSQDDATRLAAWIEVACQSGDWLPDAYGMPRMSASKTKQAENQAPEGGPLTELVQRLRGGGWDLRAPQEMADMIADQIELAALAATPQQPAQAPDDWLDQAIGKLGDAISNAVTATVKAHGHDGRVHMEEVSAQGALSEALDAFEREMRDALATRPAQAPVLSEREAFEHAERASDLTRDEDCPEDYRNHCVQAAWDGWQARALLSTNPKSEPAAPVAWVDPQWLDLGGNFVTYAGNPRYTTPLYASPPIVHVQPAASDRDVRDAARYRAVREFGSALKLYVYDDEDDLASGDWRYKPSPEEVDKFADEWVAKHGAAMSAAAKEAPDGQA